MKTKLALMVLAVMISGSVSAKNWVLTSAEQGTDKGNWQINSSELNIQGKPFSIEQKVLHGGKQEGSKLLVIRSQDGLTITLIPTRGMNLLRVEGFGTRLAGIRPLKRW